LDTNCIQINAEYFYLYFLFYQSSEEDFKILSIIPAVEEGDDSSSTPGPVDVTQCQWFQVTPLTAVTFIARRYALAFVLDLSPSLALLVMEAYVLKCFI